MKSKLGIIMILMCVVSFFIYQAKDTKQVDSKREKLIQGKVVDASTNKPIEGVSIAFQGENPKSLSNAQGEFAILALNDQELVFRHGNYKSQVVIAKDAKLVKMELADTEYIEKVKADFPNAEINQ